LSFHCYWMDTGLVYGTKILVRLSFPGLGFPSHHFGFMFIVESCVPFSHCSAVAFASSWHSLLYLCHEHLCPGLLFTVLREADISLALSSLSKGPVVSFSKLQFEVDCGFPHAFLPWGEAGLMGPALTESSMLCPLLEVSKIPPFYPGHSHSYLQLSTESRRFCTLGHLPASAESLLGFNQGYLYTDLSARFFAHGFVLGTILRIVPWPFPRTAPGVRMGACLPACHFSKDLVQSYNFSVCLLLVNLGWGLFWLLFCSLGVGGGSVSDSAKLCHNLSHSWTTLNVTGCEPIA
jgi:hypothetical protein